MRHSTKQLLLCGLRQQGGHVGYDNKSVPSAVKKMLVPVIWTKSNSDHGLKEAAEL